MSRHLILGTAFNYGIAQVRVFVESLRRHYDGEVALLISSRCGSELAAYLHTHRVRGVTFDCSYWMPIDLQFARYIRYGELLRDALEPYERVMFSDVGDVLFQADPFVGLPAGELLLFLEDERTTIGASPANALWIEQLYGAAVLDRHRSKSISCSGTTIGSHAAICDYLERMLWEGRPELASRMGRYRGYDQGIHNVLLHSGALSNAVVVRNGDVVWTLHNVPDAEIATDADGFHTIDGRRPAVVHQYPVKPAAKRWVELAYP
jgi:hypothetical protein